jgi:hypothetical protein
MRASAVTDKPQCRKSNAADNDCDADELQRLGKLINEGMNLVGQVPDLFNPGSCQAANSPDT